MRKGRERAFPAFFVLAWRVLSGVVNPPTERNLCTHQPNNLHHRIPKRRRRGGYGRNGSASAEGVFCAALVLVMAFLLRGPDGPVDPDALHERMDAGPSWGRGVLLAALLLGLAAELDLLGRVVAAPLARIVHGRRATPRQSACMRFAAQTAFTALVVIGPLVAPTVFPSFHGWILAAFQVALALPIGRSIADCQMRCF